MKCGLTKQYNHSFDGVVMHAALVCQYEVEYE